MVKADLRQAMQASARTSRVAPVSEALVEERARPESAARRHFRPSREGKTNVTGYYPSPVKKQLRLLAAEKDTTIQALLAEALNDLFAKHGKPEIAPLESE